MKKQTTATALEPILLVDSHHGIYMMQLFCCELLAGNYRYKGISEDDVKYLADKNNMDNADYFDCVNDLENSIVLLDKDNNEYSVTYNEDLWAIPEGFDTEGWYI